MTAPPRPRAPLPRRVYWVRRLVLLLVVAVVLGTGYGLVAALADAWRERGGPTLVTTTGAEASLTPTPQPSPASSPTASPSSDATDGRRPRQRVTEEPLPEPEGVCPEADVVVEPRVTEAHVGEPIRIVLEISTEATPACTWEVSPDSVFLKVVRGGDSGEVVWSSQHCPAAMPTAQVVARQKQAAEVVVSWGGRISDPECSTLSGWVLPGRYEAVTVARGAVTPLEEEFRLRKAVPEVVTAPTPTPTTIPSADATDGSEPDADRGADPGADPTDDR